jgi:hypothetical protein
MLTSIALGFAAERMVGYPDIIEPHVLGTSFTHEPAVATA